jgi:nicotinate-nucleotide--dimethylbenzimidazole phosphoribosyltransferase
VLSNLVWTARQAMGEPGTATFSIGGVSVAGQALPLPAAAAPADVLKTLNDTLAPVGLRLEVPVSTADAAGAAVSSLVIQVRNPEPVANLLGQASQPATPVLNQILDALFAAAPDAAASRLVVNALLAAGTTRGGGRLELGGASARIGNIEVADLTPPAPPPLPAEPVELPAAFTPPPVAPEPVTAPEPVPAPSTNFAAGSGFGDSSSYESSAPVAAPPAPSGAARTSDAAAAPDGSTVAARPVATPAPGGASAPLVLGAALLAIAILALGDKLRLRRLG